MMFNDVCQNGQPYEFYFLSTVSQTTITDSTEVLDPWQGWINGPPLPIPLFGHCLTPLDKNSDSTFFIHGGRTSHWAESGKVWFFHWNNQSWAPLSDLSYAASYHACAPLTMPDGTRIIVTAGGESEGNPLKVYKSETLQRFIYKRLFLASNLVE